MEIQENTVIKSLKQNLEISVDKILSNHIGISDETEITEDEFKDIVGQIVNSKEISAITQKFFEYSETERNNFITHLDKSDLYDDDRLNSINYELIQNKSSATRLNGLNTLLKNYTVLDVVESKKWPKLSKSLRECLISRNKEVFLSALKFHIKISNHPHTIIDGSSNLIKTIAYVLQSKKLNNHSICVDLRIRAQEQMIKILHLLLNNFTQIFKNSIIEKDKQIEELIYSFLDLAVSDAESEKSYLHIIYYISILDPKAKWFKQLIFTLRLRKLVVSYLLRIPTFIRIIFKEFMFCLLHENDTILNKVVSKEFSIDVMKIAVLSSCSNIISTLMSYKCCNKLFPIDWKANENKLTPTGIVTNIISTIQSLNNTPRHKQKRVILCDTIKIILIKNNYLLYKKDILHLLIKPFLLKIEDRHRLSETCLNNLYVLKIINEICKTQDGIFIVFGFIPEYYGKRKCENQYIRSITLQEPLVISSFIEKFRRLLRSTSEREILSLAKIICDFTTNFIRHQISFNEMITQVDDMLYELLECCCNIHALHSHVIFLVNSQRLIEAALQFYKILIDKNLLLNTMNSLLKFLIIICSTATGTDCLLQKDTELLYILCKHYFFLLDDNIRDQGTFSLFFVNVSNTAPGCIAIAECRRQIITPFLNRIWKLHEDQMLFLSGSDRLVEEEVFKYMKFIFVLHFNLNCVQSLLTTDNDDESTLVDTEEKPSSLKDLVDETLNITGPATLPCYVGLCTIKLLLTNLDVFLYLEEEANLQLDLVRLQSQCTIGSNDPDTPSSGTTLIIDECSLMRQHIIEYIESIGTVNSQSNKPRTQRRLNDFQKFLNESRSGLHDQNWLLKARNILRQTCEPSVRACNDAVFVDLIQQIRLTIPNIKNLYIWPESDKKLQDLFLEDYHGIALIVRFGKKNKILPIPLNYEENLAVLLKQVYSFLNVKRDRFEGFDWFVGIVFLICAGNTEKTKIVLQCLINFPISLYIWPTFGLHVGQNKNFNFFIHFDHSLNMLVGDLEIFKPALENANISWNFLVRKWINQCFFNVLEWNEICNFLVVCILYPIDYVLFFFICCAQHLESNILTAITSNNFNNYEKLQYLSGLHITDCFDSLEQLGKQYKNILASRY